MCVCCIAKRFNQINSRLIPTPTPIISVSVSAMGLVLNFDSAVHLPHVTAAVILHIPGLLLLLVVQLKLADAHIAITAMMTQSTLTVNLTIAALTHSLLMVVMLMVLVCGCVRVVVGYF